MDAGSGAIPATSMNAWSTLAASVPVPSSGYLYIWVSNETYWVMFYDNLSIQHIQGPMLEENHYYPFGLTIAPLSDKALKTKYGENKFRYNGKELQNKEFNDGSGLEEYDYGARFQDPQIGRWTTLVPKAEKYISGSPYSYASNNPIVMVDPNGKDAVIYDDRGRKVATFHNDKVTIEKGMEKSNALTAFQTAVKYVDGKTNTYKDIFKSKSVVNFHIGNFKEASTDAKNVTGPDGKPGIPINHLSDGKVGAQQVDINWNPALAGVSGDGGINSPAMVLLHEATHGDHLITDAQRVLDDKLDTQVLPGYDNREEYRTIQEVNAVSRNLPLENNRADHGGKFMPVIGTVTSTVLKPTNPPASIDKTRSIVMPR